MGDQPCLVFTMTNHSLVFRNRLYLYFLCIISFSFCFFALNALVSLIFLQMPIFGTKAGSSELHPLWLNIVVAAQGGCGRWRVCFCLCALSSDLDEIQRAWLQILINPQTWTRLKTEGQIFMTFCWCVGIHVAQVSRSGLDPKSGSESISNMDVTQNFFFDTCCVSRCSRCDGCNI